jgi:protein SCO1/2
MNLKGLNLKLGILAATLSLVGIASAKFEPGATPEYPASETPADFKDIGIDENLGTELDLSLPFVNEKGEAVTLGQYFDGKKPVSISLVYYSCPGLCNFHLNGVVDAMKELDWTVGGKFDVLAISFDPREQSEVAAGKKQAYLEAYGRPESEKGWHFLTGDEASVKALTKSVGFKYKWNDETKEWAHASAAILVTPQGRVARYLHGIMFDASTLKLALQEATEGRIGSLVERMVYYCFRYDPHQSKYTIYAFRLVQVGFVLMVLALAGILFPYWRRGFGKGRA